LSKHVIGIDFGGSYTKVACREGFTEGRIRHFEERTSRIISFEGERLIPSIAIETGQARRPWVFGWQAAGMRPGSGMVVHRNWKADLLRPNGEAPSESALGVAHGFFGWLREQLSGEGLLPFNPDEAAVMLCVPAFENSGEALSRIAEAMEAVGWENEWLLRTTEPKANTIGYCTKGRNVRTAFDTPNFGEMFDISHPFIDYTRNSPHGEPKTLAVLDIGSFTSDLSLIRWHPRRDEDGYLGDGRQFSFRHGVVEQIDLRCLPEILDDVSESYEELEFAELERIKEDLYRGKRHELGGFSLGDEHHRQLIDGVFDRFCTGLWNRIHPVLSKEPVQWWILTGGGSNIPCIRRWFSRKFKSLASGNNKPSELESKTTQRTDTALGATSLILFIDSSGEKRKNRKSPEEQPDPVPPLGNCPCQGINPNCMRCGGSGIIGGDPLEKTSPGIRNPGTGRVRGRDFGGRKNKSKEFDAEELTAPDAPAMSGEKPRIPDLDDELNEFTLEGWMGSLVFGSRPGSGRHNYKTFKEILESADSERRNAAWYRLLCLACMLGARVSRSTIREFWRTTLEKSRFWEITTGETRDTGELDRFFEQLIHREFRNIDAEGEQAELLRRVFYDFRKLHCLIYENDFAEVVLEVFGQIDDGFDPVRFLRSGWRPDDRPWRGVVGQSMTSPLLFLMREWRRAGLIESDRMDHHCYYMNAAARRGACRIGWLDWEQLYACSLSEILDASARVHEKLTGSGEWNPMDFDIPLQIIGTKRNWQRA